MLICIFLFCILTLINTRLTGLRISVEHRQKEIHTKRYLQYMRITTCGIITNTELLGVS